MSQGKGGGPVGTESQLFFFSFFEGSPYFTKKDYKSKILYKNINSKLITPTTFCFGIIVAQDQHFFPYRIVTSKCKMTLKCQISHSFGFFLLQNTTLFVKVNYNVSLAATGRYWHTMYHLNSSCGSKQIKKNNSHSHLRCSTRNQHISSTPSTLSILAGNTIVKITNKDGIGTKSLNLC